MIRTHGIDNDRTLVNWTLPLVSCHDVWNSELDVAKLVAMINGLPLQDYCSKHVQTKLLPDMENPASMAEQAICLLQHLRMKNI